MSVYVNALRVRVRSAWWQWPLMFVLWVMALHARRAEGFRGARLQRTPERVPWLLVLWESLRHIPTWSEVLTRLRRAGRFPKLPVPSAEHLARTLGEAVPDESRGGLHVAARRPW